MKDDYVEIIIRVKEDGWHEGEVRVKETENKVVSRVRIGFTLGSAINKLTEGDHDAILHIMAEAIEYLSCSDCGLCLDTSDTEYQMRLAIVQAARAYIGHTKAKKCATPPR